MTHITANTAQLAFGGFNDDGSLTTSTAIVATNTNWSQRRDAFFRVRFAVAEIAGGDPKGPTHFVQYSINGGAFAAVGTTTPVKFGTSAFVADATAVTTQRLGAALGAFTNGEYDQDGTVASVAYGANGGTEMEYGLVIDSAQTAVNDTIQLRLSDVDQYTQTPTITAIDILAPNAPTLVDPADGATVDLAAPQTFDWTFSGDEPGDAQTAFAFRRVDLSAIAYSILAGTPTLDDIGWAIDYSPDNSMIAVGTGNLAPFLQIVDTATWTIMSGTPTDMTATVRGLRFSSDGTKLAIMTWASPYLIVYNTADWTTVSGTPVLTGNQVDVEFSPDGTLLATSEVRVYRTSDWVQVLNAWQSGGGRAVTFSPDGTLLATGNTNNPNLIVYNTADWTIATNTVGLDGDVQGLSFKSDGSLLAVGLRVGTDNLVIVDTATWTVADGPTRALSDVVGVEFSPDGTLLAAGADSFDASLTIYNTSDWSEVLVTDSAGRPLEGVAFNSDGSLLATAGWDTPYLTVLERSVPEEWWNGTSWQLTEVFISSAISSVTFPGNSW